jgi:hypothetical protein
MRLRLKADPREWRKFSWTLSVVLVLVVGLLVWRQQLSLGVALSYGVLACGLSFWGWRRPSSFRRTYRVAMTGAHHMGQWVGRVLLTLVYCLMVVPLGLCLRGLGKDLLGIKGRAGSSAAESYWRRTRTPGPLDRLF